MLNEPISASKQFDGITMRAEFHLDSGRLRIFGETAIRTEWFTPQSWLAVVSVAGHSTWSRRPHERDLVLLLNDFRSRRVGVRSGDGTRCEAGSRPQTGMRPVTLSHLVPDFSATDVNDARPSHTIFASIASSDCYGSRMPRRKTIFDVLRAIQLKNGCYRRKRLGLLARTVQLLG